jgi:hypothetical protein
MHPLVLLAAVGVRVFQPRIADTVRDDDVITSVIPYRTCADRGLPAALSGRAHGGGGRHTGSATYRNSDRIRE